MMDINNDHDSWQIAGAKSAFSQVISRAAIKPQIIKNREEPVAVIVSVEDFKTLEAAKMKWREFTEFSRALAADDSMELTLPSRELTTTQF